MNNTNYAYFESNLKKLLEQYGGKFIIIKDETVIEAYNSFDEAYQSAIKTEQLGTFLIQHCVENEEDTVAFVSGNVSFA